jgi:hypothetical protein
VAAVALGAVILIVASEAIPYHIDELRQIAAYDEPYSVVVEASLAQQQPPLNSVLGASVQRLLGVGDWQQRLVSVLAGIGALITVGIITLRAGFKYGAAATVLILALSPVFVTVTAYARPYALPLFLALLFVLMTDLWLVSAHSWVVVGILGSAMLLPLSRPTEPLLVLGAAIAILAAYLVFGRSKDWVGTPWVPIGVSGLALIAVGMPMLVPLRSSLGQYSDLGIDVGEILERAGSDLPGAFDRLFPLLPVVIVLVVAAVALPASRRLLNRWWFLVLALVPVGFIASFYAGSAGFVPFSDRYTYFLWVALAIVMGALVGGLPAGTGRRFDRAIPVLTGVLIVLFVSASAVALGRNLSQTTIDATMDLEYRPDFEAASNLIAGSTPGDALVLFDVARPLYHYRNPFAGSGRYIDDSRLIISVLEVTTRPALPAGLPIAVLTLGTPVEVTGWNRVTRGQFHLYTPTNDLRGAEGAIEAMVAMSEAHGSDIGATWALAAAAVVAQEGGMTAACSMVAEVGKASPDEGYSARFHDAIANGGYLRWLSSECAQRLQPK